MFNKKVILFLKRDSLELYTSAVEGLKNRLLFPPEIIKYEEIIDETKLENLITSFLQKEITQNQKVIILLSPDILFQKTISSPDKAIQENEVKKFTDEIPFDIPKTATIKVPTASGLNLIATNKKLYLPAITAVEKLNSEVEAVIPSTIFGITKNQELAKNDIAQIIKNPKLVKASDFLLSQPDSDSQIDQKETKSSAKIHKSILIFLFFVLIIIFGISFVFIKQKRQAVSPKKGVVIPQVSPTPAPIKESTATAEIEKISKEDLKIQILNGSGIAGQAQDLADLLKSDSFTNINLGNSTTTSNTQTTVSFKDRVPQTAKDNLIQKLKEIFAEVKVETLVESGFDIKITTGKLKTP